MSSVSNLKPPTFGWAAFARAIATPDQSTPVTSKPWPASQEAISPAPQPMSSMAAPDGNHPDSTASRISGSIELTRQAGEKSGLAHFLSHRNCLRR